MLLNSVNLTWPCVFRVELSLTVNLQCKRQFARRDQISEFHTFAPQNAAPCTVPHGEHAPFAPLPAATGKGESLTNHVLLSEN